MTDPEAPESASQTWQDLGLIDELCEACQKLNWKKPSKVQAEVIPIALAGRDIIGLAKTGSGKTGAFALPIIQALLEKPQRLFALILAPTRELAIQIHQDFEELGEDLGLKCAAIVGGVNMEWQAKVLSKKPHIVVATPGRLNDHLENTKGFHLKLLKYLVFDEADRTLDMDYEVAVDMILEHIPKERHTYLFSATMTTKVKELQRACLNDPVKIELNEVYQTPETLQQYYIFPPFDFKDVWLYHILCELAGSNTLVFCNTCHNAVRIKMLLQKLGLYPVALHGQMTQKKRLDNLNKFKTRNRSILVATEVASRGLDIRHMDVVINFDLPKTVESYIHRVGRTARAGRAGKAITFVTQYDIGRYQHLEKEMGGKKLPLYETVWDDVMKLKEKVSSAADEAKRDLRELEKGKSKTKKRKQKEVKAQSGRALKKRRRH